MMADKVTETPRILVVDDEPQMRSIVTFALETQGFQTSTANSVSVAWKMLTEQRFSLVVLDLMLPDGSGIDLCRRIRAKMSTPVIMLTALGEEEDRVEGLEAGADDYVTKPFSPRELALRVTAVLRRFNPDSSAEVLENGDLRQDVNTLELTFRDRRIPLGDIESRLCLSLMRHAGQVVAPRTLLNEVWDSSFIPGGKDVLKATVYRLRKTLIKETGQDDLIVNERSRGYMMRKIPSR